jgi:Rieske Fe-S protein
MASTPVANPAPLLRPHGFRPALAAAAASSVAAIVIGVAIAFVWPQDSQLPAYRWVRLGAIDDFPLSEPVAVPEHAIWMVRLDGGVPDPIPGSATHDPFASGEVIALSQRSTHLGCTVAWRPDFPFNGQVGFFRDPCSGSVWSAAGVRMYGPAPRNLDRYPLVARNGEIHVDVNNRLCGEGYELETRQLFCLPPTEYVGTFPGH